MNLLFCGVFALLALKVDFLRADCGVVTKKEWDGLNPVSVKYLARPVDLVIVQHTATRKCDNDKTCAEIVRAIQSNHMENLNLDDIGVSFLIGGNGKVYEGVGWLHVGAHTYGYNSKSIGISFIGNFNNDEPTTQMVEAAKALIRCGVENGHLTSNYHLVAHRQLVATESPGRKLYNVMRGWPDWTRDVTSIKNKT